MLSVSHKKHKYKNIDTMKLNLLDISQGSLMVCLIWKYFIPNPRPNQEFKSKQGTVLPQVFTNSGIFQVNYIMINNIIYSQYSWIFLN